MVFLRDPLGFIINWFVTFASKQRPFYIQYRSHIFDRGCWCFGSVCNAILHILNLV